VAADAGCNPEAAAVSRTAIAFDAGPVPEMYSLRYRTRTCLPGPGWCDRSSKGETTPALASALSYAP
jgi:hypothetical protein